MVKVVCQNQDGFRKKQKVLKEKDITKFMKVKRKDQEIGDRTKKVSKPEILVTYHYTVAVKLRNR